MPPVDASSTTTPNLWSTLPSTSVLASKRKETVLKAFSIVHHERGDARLGHGAKGSPPPRFRQCVRWPPRDSAGAFMHNYDFSRFASRGAPIASGPPHSIPRLHSASQTAHQRVHRASVGDRSSPAQRLLTCRRARWYCSATFEAMTMIFGLWLTSFQAASGTVRVFQ